MSVVSWGEGTCRLIKFIKQWTGETDGGHPSQCSMKSVEFPASFFLSMDHFLGCIFPIHLNLLSTHHLHTPNAIHQCFFTGTTT